MKGVIVVVAVSACVLFQTMNYVDAKSCTEYTDSSKCKNKDGCKWTGQKKGCCKKKKNGKCESYWNDAGCRTEDYCNFNCKDLCVNNKKSGCAWNGKSCIYLPSSEYEYGYEYSTGIVEETNGLLIYQSSVTVPANVGLSGFDQICVDSRPTKNALCAEGYPSIAMVCSDKRDVDSMATKLAMPKSSKVVGPNKKELETLTNIMKADVLMDNAADATGITIKSFWSGCDKNGQITDNLGMDCGNWKSNFQFKSGILGDTSKIVSSTFKFWSSADCNTEQRLLCLCPRAK